MKRFRWPAVLTLAIALAPGAASAQEADTLSISSMFNMDWLNGNVGPDLAEVYANGHEHTWTLRLHGTTQSHDTFSSFGVTNRVTEIHATSFDLEFFGPDAVTLNGIVSEHIAGGDVMIYLRNAYWAFGDFAIMYVWPMGPDVEFFSGHDTIGSDTLFPSDADGYPVVGPDPFSIWAEVSYLIDNRPGNNGSIESRQSLVTLNVVPDLPGDFNFDGSVDAADYTVWRESLGQSGTGLAADGDGNDQIDSGDYDIWRAHYGESSGFGAIAGSAMDMAAPEPGGIVLLTLSVPALLRRQSRRRREWSLARRSTPCRGAGFFELLEGNPGMRATQGHPDNGLMYTHGSGASQAPELATWGKVES